MLLGDRITDTHTKVEQMDTQIADVHQQLAKAVADAAVSSEQQLASLSQLTQQLSELSGEHSSSANRLVEEQQQTTGDLRCLCLLLPVYVKA